MSPIIISIANHKGGVQKTTTTVNLGAGLARAGYKTLLIDCDAQQNLTMSLIGMIELDLDRDDQQTFYTALMDQSSLDDLIVNTGRPNLDIIPCAEDLSGIDLSLVMVMSRETVLKKCLSKTVKLNEYDFVLIDNPPSISLMVVNTLAVSDYFLVPVSADYLPMVGLTMFGNSVGKMQEVNPSLRPLGVVITNFTPTESICRTVESTLRKELGEVLFKTKIRVNTKAKNAPGLRRTIFEQEASGTKVQTAAAQAKMRGTEDYTSLIGEILTKLGMPLTKASEAETTGIGNLRVLETRRKVA